MIITKTDLIDEILQLIGNSVPLVFETMLTSQATPIPLDGAQISGVETVMGSVGFIGDVNGMVYLHLGAPLANKLSARMLQLSERDIENEMVNDVVGEISNMVVGSVKSQLCDSGSPCSLTIPSIVRGHGLSVEPVSTAQRRYLNFNCGGDDRLLVELLIKQPA